MRESSLFCTLIWERRGRYRGHSNAAVELAGVATTAAFVDAILSLTAGERVCCALTVTLLFRPRLSNQLRRSGMRSTRFFKQQGSKTVFSATPPPPVSLFNHIHRYLSRQFVAAELSPVALAAEMSISVYGARVEPRR